jgi:hypothetical protein
MINNTQIDSTERLGIIVQIEYPPNQIEWRHDPQNGFVQVCFMHITKTKRRTAFDAKEGHPTTVSQLFHSNKAFKFLHKYCIYSVCME